MLPLPRESISLIVTVTTEKAASKRQSFENLASYPLSPINTLTLGSEY